MSACRLTSVRTTETTLTIAPAKVHGLSIRLVESGGPGD